MRVVYWVCVCCVSWVSSIHAFEVEALGRAAIQNSVGQAKSAALDDAMRQASLRAGAQISSTQLMKKGVVTEDSVQVRSQAQLDNVKVLWEQQRDGLYEVAIRANVQPEALCPSSTQRYRKAVAVAGFGLAKPTQATLGQLQNIEQDLPRVLLNTLNHRGGLHAMDASRVSLYSDPRRAPSSNNQQRHLTTSVALATELGAQYVISGVVRDLSTLGDVSVEGAPSTDFQRNKARWLSLVGLDTQPVQRQFVLDVFVHDGLSGALLFQRSYQTEGEWTLPVQQNVSFASPAFWSSPYGGNVRNVLTRVVDEVDEVLRCQPFMARIVKAKGKRLHIEASAGAGIRPGDRFQVYRTGTFYNLDLEARTELSDMATEVVVKQVQPQFIIAEMSRSAAYLAIQRDDMIIAW